MDATTDGQTYTTPAGKSSNFNPADDLFTDTFTGGSLTDSLSLAPLTTTNVTVNMTGEGAGTINYSNAQVDNFSSIETIHFSKQANTLNINALTGFNNIEFIGNTASTATNTFAVNVSTSSLDLTQVNASNFTTIDLSNTSANVALTLYDSDVKTFTGDKDLYINGDSADSIDLSSSFSLTSSDATYNIYTAVSAQAYGHKLYINKAITSVTNAAESIHQDVTTGAQTYNGFSGTNNTFVAAADTSYSDIFNGNNGTDVLELSGIATGKTIDLSGVGSGTVSYGANTQSDSFTNIEEVNLGGHGSVVTVSNSSDLNSVNFRGAVEATDEVHLKNTTAETLTLSTIMNKHDSLDLIDLTGATSGVNNILQLSSADLPFSSENPFQINGDAGDVVRLNSNESWTKGAQGATHTEWSYTDTYGDSYTIAVDNNIVNIDTTTYSV